MAKKIVLSVLLVGFVAVLLVGAIVRTSARSAERGTEPGRQAALLTASAPAGEPTHNGRVEEQGAVGRGVGRGSGQGGQGLGTAEKVEGGQGRGQGLGTAESVQGGQGRGQGLGRGEAAVEAGATDPRAEVAPEDWVALQGTVASVSTELVEIATTGGDLIPFEGRPLSYSIEQGFALHTGDAVRLEGFDEVGEFKLGKVTNLTTGAAIALRDAGGRPGWAGRGRRGG